MKPGDVLIFTSGEYSDYYIQAVAIVEREFSKADVAEKYLTKYPDRVDSWGCGKWASDFVLWLTVKGYAREVDRHELRFRDPYVVPTRLTGIVADLREEEDD